jgi:glycosyltransferase involved in cell wall biosynthesis
MDEKVKRKKILVFDFNIVWEILSGYSMLNQVLSDEYNDYYFIFNRHCQLSKLLEEKGYEVRVVNYGCSSNLIMSIFQYFNLLLHAILFIFKLDPDVIHANNAMAGRVSVPIAKLCGRKIVVHIRNTGLPPRTYHLIRYVDRVLAVSHCVKDSLNIQLKSKTDVVYDCHESNLFNLKKSSDQLIIAMSSRLSSQKGIDNFVNLATRFEDNPNSSLISFVHCGGIPAEDNELGFSPSSVPIVWRGYIDNVDQFWQEANIAIIPSVGPEAFGRVVIEAMSNGAIPIASRCGGPEEIIEDGVNGFLFDINDTNRLYDIVFKLITDPDLSEKISQNAISTAKSKFSNKFYVEIINSSYVKAIHGEVN